MSEYMPPIGLHEKPAWRSAEKTQLDAEALSAMKSAKSTEKTQMSSITGSSSFIRTAPPGEAAEKTQSNTSGMKPFEAEKTQLTSVSASVQGTAEPDEAHDKTLLGIKPVVADRTQMSSIPASIQRTAMPGEVPDKTQLNGLSKIKPVEAPTQMQILDGEAGDTSTKTSQKSYITRSQEFNDAGDVIYYDGPEPEKVKPQMWKPEMGKPEQPLEMRPMAFKAIDNGDGTLRLEEAPGFELKLTNQELYIGLAVVYIAVVDFLITVILVGAGVNYFDGFEVEHLH